MKLSQVLNLGPSVISHRDDPAASHALVSHPKSHYTTVQYDAGASASTSEPAALVQSPRQVQLTAVWAPFSPGFFRTEGGLVGLERGLAPLPGAGHLFPAQLRPKDVKFST